MEVDQRDHVVVGRLEERMFDVSIHHVQLFALGRLVAEAVGVGLELSGHFAALARKGRAHPDVLEDDDALLAGDELFLLDQSGPLGLLLIPGHDDAPQRLDIPDDRCRVIAVGRPERQLLDEALLGEHGARLPLRSEVKVDPDEVVLVLLGRRRVLDGQNVERHHDAIDREQDRLALRVHVDRQVVHLTHIADSLVRDHVCHLSLLDLAPAALVQNAQRRLVDLLQQRCLALGLPPALLLPLLEIHMLCPSRLSDAGPRRPFLVHPVHRVIVTLNLIALDTLEVRNVIPVLLHLTSERFGGRFVLDQHRIRDEDGVLLVAQLLIAVRARDILQPVQRKHHVEGHSRLEHSLALLGQRHRAICQLETDRPTDAFPHLLRNGTILLHQHLLCRRIHIPGLAARHQRLHGRRMRLCHHRIPGFFLLGRIDKVRAADVCAVRPVPRPGLAHNRPILDGLV
mmetsp:Transcript_5836/g.16343  ORF Transcript_5836/g.16343 Transcript_5836/m.16343 type:complete len:456 (-) Transcript_5836:920-2287(-)